MEFGTMLLLGGLGFSGLFALSLVRWVLSLRRVVSTNEVHIIQRGKDTTSYGKDTGHGNTYYAFPSWIPILGLNTIILPTSNFTLKLNDYEAYDQGRLPFVVDIAAFFRVSDSNTAAQRISSNQDLIAQLTTMVQGAVRSILASNEIESIMQGRSTFGEQFTKEVSAQLAEWGVKAVKNMELMDIRDSKGSQVIHNIMAKKQSHIEMESRQEVAKNKKTAQIAEIEAQREVELQKQEASQQVGIRTTEANRQVELAKQEMQQLVKEQEKLTKEKEMSVLKVGEVRKAEILKEMAVVKANQDKEVAVLTAEGNLEATKRYSEGITLEGNAKASAERAMLLAPVEAQTTLAKEIGSNEGYQKYLLGVKQIEANEHVGIESAKALTAAEVKIIANTGSPSTGLNSVMDLFSSAGGTQVGAMLEGLANTDKGQQLLSKAGLTTTETKTKGKNITNGVHQ